MAVGFVSVRIPNDTYKLGFIRAVKMAESIARGIVKSGVLPASRIRTAHLGSSHRAAFESFGVKVFKRNVEEINKLYEAKQNFKQAIVYYEGATDLFQSEDVTASASQCSQKTTRGVAVTIMEPRHAGRHLVNNLAKESGKTHEELSTELKLQHKEACTTVHERLLIYNTRDYGTYDPTPAFDKPASNSYPTDI